MSGGTPDRVDRFEAPNVTPTGFERLIASIFAQLGGKVDGLTVAYGERVKGTDATT